MNDGNVISITGKLDDWRLIKEFYTVEHLVEVWGNYRKNAHEIRIVQHNGGDVTYSLMDIAQLQDAIKEYEEREQ